jgi:hypothetical protein
MSDPTHRAYTLLPRKGKDDQEEETSFWLNIGSLFPHKDGKGFNLVLDALPLDGRLVIREIKEAPPAPMVRKSSKR